ncbi:uncharacterized protein LOC132705689 isoform X2 [Cylas formicarius]|nr:uncharacterized protein LOC132705689 isoform X2 [Cylas formicarius]
MRTLLHLLVLFVILSVAKAYSFVKLVILAGLGLAGLWMIHTLAQDLNSIMQTGGLGTSTSGLGSATLINGLGGGGLLRNLGLSSGPQQQQEQSAYGEQEIQYYNRRSVREIKDSHKSKIDWGLVISRDPASCARSFICQLAASKESNLTKEERIILKLSRDSVNETSYAGQELRESLENGNLVKYPYQCMKFYKLCPYTKRIMMSLLKVFGGR